MKKITILLIIILSVCFVVDSFYDEKEAEELAVQQEMERIKEWEEQQKNEKISSTNKLLSNYAGVKKRGSLVNSLFDLVETLNEQDVFPIDIRYGDVSPDSHEWNNYSKVSPNLNSGDIIRDSAWYEVVIQDQLPKENPDKYWDTIAIRIYQR